MSEEIDVVDEEKTYKRQLKSLHSGRLSFEDLRAEGDCRHLLKIIHSHKISDFSEEQAKEEAQYYDQFHNKFTVSLKEVLDRIDEKNRKDREETERSLKIWAKMEASKDKHSEGQDVF